MKKILSIMPIARDSSNNISWVLYRSGILIISGIGEMNTIDCTDYNKKQIISAKIRDGVTSIGEAAFFQCSGLTEITIPDSVTSICIDAFSKCSGLTEIYYSSSEKEWESISIDSGNEYLTNATIHFNSRN